MDKRICKGCGGEFVPHKFATGKQLFCNVPCGQRFNQRVRLGLRGPGPDETTRPCRWCEQMFRNPDGRRAFCSEACGKIGKAMRQIFANYRLTLEEYRDLYRAQNGVCRVCGLADRSARATNGLLVVDHCHDSGRVRGLLCSHCNRAIGLLGDSPEILKRAAEYVAADEPIEIKAQTS